MYGLVRGPKALKRYLAFVTRDMLRREITPEMETILDEDTDDEQSETEEEGKTRPP